MLYNIQKKYKSDEARFSPSCFTRLIPFYLVTNGIGYSKIAVAIANY